MQWSCQGETKLLKYSTEYMISPSRKFVFGMFGDALMTR